MEHPFPQPNTTPNASELSEDVRRERLPTLSHLHLQSCFLRCQGQSAAVEVAEGTQNEKQTRRCLDRRYTSSSYPSEERLRFTHPTTAHSLQFPGVFLSRRLGEFFSHSFFFLGVSPLSSLTGRKKKEGKKQSALESSHKVQTSTT